MRTTSSPFLFDAPSRRLISRGTGIIRSSSAKAIICCCANSRGIGSMCSSISPFSSMSERMNYVDACARRCFSARRHTASSGSDGSPRAAANNSNSLSLLIKNVGIRRQGRNIGRARRGAVNRSNASLPRNLQRATRTFHRYFHLQQQHSPATIWASALSASLGRTLLLAAERTMILFSSESSAAIKA